MRYKKIHICGTHGSGKTTLGKILSNKLNIPFYPLVDIKYEVKYSKKRAIGKIKEKLKDISKKNKWITEECWTDHAEELFKKANIIIFLTLPKKTCQYRVLKRFFLRKKGEQDKLKGAINMVKRVNKYYSNTDKVSLKEHQKLCKKYKKKVILLKNNKEIEEFFKKIK